MQLDFHCFLHNACPLRDVIDYTADSPTRSLSTLPSRDNIVRLRGMVSPVLGFVSIREGRTSLVIFNKAAVWPSGRMGISIILIPGSLVFACSELLRISTGAVGVGFTVGADDAVLVMELIKSESELELPGEPENDTDMSDCIANVSEPSPTVTGIPDVPREGTAGTTVVTSVWRLETSGGGNLGDALVGVTIESTLFVGLVFTEKEGNCEVLKECTDT